MGKLLDWISDGNNIDNKSFKKKSSDIIFIKNSQTSLKHINNSNVLYYNLDDLLKCCKISEQEKYNVKNTSYIVGKLIKYIKNYSPYLSE